MVSVPGCVDGWDGGCPSRRVVASQGKPIAGVGVGLLAVAVGQDIPAGIPFALATSFRVKTDPGEQWEIAGLPVSDTKWVLVSPKSVSIPCAGKLRVVLRRVDE